MKEETEDYLTEYVKTLRKVRKPKQREEPKYEGIRIPKSEPYNRAKFKQGETK